MTMMLMMIHDDYMMMIHDDCCHCDYDECDLCFFVRFDVGRATGEIGGSKSHPDMQTGRQRHHPTHLGKLMKITLCTLKSWQHVC